MLERPHRILEFEARELLALEAQRENEHENRWMPVLAKALVASFVAFGLVTLADWAFYDGRHVQMAVDLFRRAGAAVGVGF